MPDGRQTALPKQRDFLGTKQTTAKLGGEAGTASPAVPEAQASRLWWRVGLGKIIYYG